MIGRKQEKTGKTESSREESHWALLGSHFHLQWLGTWGIVTGEALKTCHPCLGVGMENHTSESPRELWVSLGTALWFLGPWTNPF